MADNERLNSDNLCILSHIRNKGKKTDRGVSVDSIPMTMHKLNTQMPTRIAVLSQNSSRQKRTLYLQGYGFLKKIYLPSA